MTDTEEVGHLNQAQDKDEIKFHYMKSNQFRVIHVDGAWGELVPKKSRRTEVAEQLESLRQLPMNWNSYDAEPPNATAIYGAEIALEVLSEINFPPTRVIPSAENGVGITFRCGDRYADVEFLNTGEILALKGDAQGRPSVWYVGSRLGACQNHIWAC